MGRCRPRCSGSGERGGEVADRRRVRTGSLVDETVEYRVAGQTEEIIDAVRRAPLHCLGPAAGKLERWIEAQAVQVAGILPAAGNGEEARPQNVGQRVHDPARVAAVRDRGDRR